MACSSLLKLHVIRKSRYIQKTVNWYHLHNIYYMIFKEKPGIWAINSPWDWLRWLGWVWKRWEQLECLVIKLQPHWVLTEAFNQRRMLLVQQKVYTLWKLKSVQLYVYYNYMSKEVQLSDPYCVILCDFTQSCCWSVLKKFLPSFVTSSIHCTGIKQKNSTSKQMSTCFVNNLFEVKPTIRHKTVLS